MAKKTKLIAGTALGVVAGAGFVSGNASADEVTQPVSDSPATNLVAAQPEATVENTVAAATAGVETGTITTPVESTGLDQAVVEAQNAGVVVEEAPVETVTSIEQADTSLANQEAKVDEAKATQEEVTATQAQAEAKATEAGVELKPEATVTYKDDNKSAIEDVNSQAGKLEQAVEVQNAVNNDLPAAVKQATDAGVVVTSTEKAKYQDAQKALADLSAQVAKLETAKATQEQVDSAIALAVAEAQRAGVKVNLGNPTTIKDVQTALATAQAQVQALVDAELAQSSANKTIDNAKANATASGTVVETIGTITVSADQADAKAKEIANAINAVVVENNEITASNAEKQATYEAQKAEADASNADALAQNEAIKASNEQKLAQYNRELQKVLDGYTPTEDGFTKEQIQSFLNGVDVGSAGFVNIANVTNAGDIRLINDTTRLFTQADVDRYYNWTQSQSNEEFKNAYTREIWEDGLTTRGSDETRDTSHFHIVKVGDTFTYTNVVSSGGQHYNLKYTITDIQTNDYSSIGVTGLPENEAILIMDEYAPSFTQMTFFTDIFYHVDIVDDDGNPVTFQDIILGFGDLDWRQEFELKQTPVNTLHGDNVVQLSNNEWKAKSMFSLDTNYAPAQGWFVLKNASSFDYRFGFDSYEEALAYYNSKNYLDGETVNPPDYGVGDDGKTLGGAWHALGGLGFVLDIPTPPTLEKEQPIDPVVVTPPTFEELKKASIQDVQVTANVTPITLETETHTITMVVPTHDVVVATSVNPVQVTQTPSNSKAVNNTEGVDINGTLVAKSSTVKWVLSNEALKGGRDNTVSYIMTDPLPVGFELNLLATAEATPDYNIKYDRNTNTVTFTAKDATLNAFNADLTKSITIPVATIIGTVLNDGATYQNTFTTTVTSAETVIVDKDGKVTPNGKTETYKVVSNTPEVYTPGSDVRTYNGNVVVRYFTEENGKAVKIAPNQTDLEDAKVGTKYDTKDQKEPTIAFEGKTYKLTEKVVGNETGDVTRGTIFVDYYYEIVPEVDGEGNVIVHYQDEEGNKISNDVVDTPNSPIGTDYTTTDNKPDVITTEDGIKYELVPTKTIGKEDGKVEQGTTEVTYIYKRLTPKPATPTPTDNIIKPVKHIYTKDGQQVDGMTLLPNTEVNYTAVFDLDQFKGMVATAEDIAKGIAFFDDLQDNTVTIDVAGITNTLADGTPVTGLVATEYASVDEAPEALKAIIEKSGISLDGKFIAWVPENPTDFYNKYIVTGQSIYHTMPITTGDYVGTFQNKVWQVVFGNGYEGNVVENNIPKLEAIKDAVKSIGSNESVANGFIELGQTFPYVLDGPAILANIVGGLTEYKFKDDFDEEHDEYNGEFYAFADQDIVLSDGSVIRKGDEITRYFVQNIIRNEDGKAIAVELTVDPNFLASIDKDSVFDPMVYLVVTRIAYGENIENTFTVTVNGYEVTSNTVVTHTPVPTPPAPNTPEQPGVPVTPAPEVPNTPVEEAAMLPSTGEESSTGTVLAGLAMIMASILGLFGLKRKED